MTKTKEKVVDLSKPEKVSEGQLKKIQTIVERINQYQMNIGQLEARKHQILHLIAGVNDELTLMQEELQKEYGTNDVNIMDGTINYPKDVKANKKD